MATPHLLQPLTIGNLTARNRLWLPPMCMYSVDAEDGVVTDWHVLHYGTRAVGGFGTVVVEATAVLPEGRLSPQDLGLWDETQVAGHRRIAAAIHDGGALAAIQLGHGGRKAGTSPMCPGQPEGTLPGWEPVAPSPLAFPGLAVPRELSAQEVDEVVDAFAAAARRAVEAGYDLIELHGAHGYLLHQFLSPLSNSRTDSYGGSPLGRRRLVLEVVEAVHAVLGPRTALGIRLSATDWLDGGLTGQDTAELASLLVPAGVDVLHISSGALLPARIPIGPGYQVPLAAQVKAAVAGTTTHAGSTPVVVAVGLITNGIQAEQIVGTGQADAVATGRAGLRDPYLPVRWAHELGVNDWQEAGLPIQYWRGAYR